ncbi:MAG: hypothetical protein RR053_05910, partial [Evtepia sp.]
MTKRETDESRLYCDIVRQSTDGVYVIEQESHKLLYANDAMEVILKQVGIRDYVGQICYCVLRHRDQPCLDCVAYPPTRVGEAREVYVDFLSKYYSVASYAIEWQGVPAYVIYLADISEKKRANNEIAHIYNNIPGAVFCCKFDEDWTIISAND